MDSAEPNYPDQNYPHRVHCETADANSNATARRNPKRASLPDVPDHIALSANIIARALHLQSTVRATERDTSRKLSLETSAGLLMKLGDAERHLLADAALRALRPDIAEDLVTAFLSELHAGPPMPPLTTLHEEAKWWASMASPSELRAYIAAAWGQMTEEDKVSFLRAVDTDRTGAP